MKYTYIIYFIVAFAMVSCHQKDEESSEQTVENVENSDKIYLDDSKLSMDDLEFFTMTNSIHKQERLVPAVVQAAPNYIGYLAAPVDGIVKSVYLNEGDRVVANQVVMEIESLEYGQLLSDFLQAYSEYVYQEGRQSRNEKLIEKGLTSQSEMELIRADYQRSKSYYAAMRARLLALGLSEQEVENLKTSDAIEPHLLIRSEINGVIDQHFVELGMPVRAFDQLATVVNTEQVLVKAFLSPEDLMNVSVGDSVEINRLSDQSGGIYSVVSSINPALDENSRSVIANIIVKSHDNWPLPGENVRVKMQSEIPENLLAVPVEAISWLGEKAVVYVLVDEKVLQVREIQIVESDDNFSFVSHGLKVGEQIATNEIFTLKSLVRFNEFAD